MNGTETRVTCALRGAAVAVGMTAVGGRVGVGTPKVKVTLQARVSKTIKAVNGKIIFRFMGNGSSQRFW
jgi:hypothetical protein